MATACTIGTAKSPTTIPLLESKAALTDNDTLDGVESHAGFLSAVPSDDPENGAFLITLPIGGDLAVTNSLALGFFGTDAAGEKVRARIWGITPIDYTGASDPTQAFGVYLGELEIELGALAYAGSGGATPFNDSAVTYLFADSIGVVQDYSSTPPGMRIIGAASGAFAMVFLDSMGFTQVFVSLAVDDAAKAGLVWRAF